jgi:serine/threonine protein kinase
MCDTITGLAHMHHCEPEPLLHRDLKPENLLVSRAPPRMALFLEPVDGGSAAVCDPGAGSGAGSGVVAGAGVGAGSGACAGGFIEAASCSIDVVVKLGDLGLAKAVAGGRTHHSSGAGTGTQTTLSPEALRGKYDAPGDVYSWAKCMCWVIMDALRLQRTETELRTYFVVSPRTHAGCWLCALRQTDTYLCSGLANSRAFTPHPFPRHPAPPPHELTAMS